MYHYDYKGAIHIHSTYSDGKGEVKEIMDCANDVGLDFVILTDHDNLKALDEGLERWYGSSLLIVGTEISPRYNHYIAFGNGRLSNVEFLRNKKPQEFIDEISREGWLGFISHPDHEGTKRFEIESYKWLDWEVERFQGYCLWDLMSDWQEKLDRDELSMDIYHNFINYLSGPKGITMARWDEFNQKRKVIGIGELDNHRSERDYQGEKIIAFPYETGFKTILNHVLLENALDKDPNKAKAQILEAISKGRLYISFDWWDDPTEFSFQIEDDEKLLFIGDEGVFKGNAELIVSLPLKAYLTIFLNGRAIKEEEGDELIMKVDSPGVYRIEAYRNDLVWVISNPIYLRSPL
jgi:hypothetical protein